MIKIGKLRWHAKLGYWHCTRPPEKPKYFGPKGISYEEALVQYEALVQEYDIKNKTAEQNAAMTRVSGLVAFYVKNCGMDKESKCWSDKKRYLDLFVEEFGSKTPDEVEPWMIDAWMAEQTDWGQTTKGNVFKHLSSCFNWLLTQRKIKFNLVRGCKRPPAKLRSDKCIITQAEHNMILAEIPVVYRGILTLLWEVGCRPDEACSATAEMYREDDHELVLTEHKTDDDGHDRVLFLTETANALVKNQIEKVKTGLLWKSVNGQQIAPDVLYQAFDRAKERCGLKDREIFPYSYRHGFANRKIREGSSIEEVATLLGNSVAVAAKNYAHSTAAMRDRRAAKRKEEDGKS